MKDTFCKREYKCKCGCIMIYYVWKSELPKKNVTCSMCNTKLGVNNLKIKEIPQTASIRTPTKNR